MAWAVGAVSWPGGCAQSRCSESLRDSDLLREHCRHRRLFVLPAVITRVPSGALPVYVKKKKPTEQREMSLFS